VLVEMMNGIGHAVHRPIDFLHIPVPQDRVDDAYFAPLADWRARRETRLYLGLLPSRRRRRRPPAHQGGRRVVPDFGVAAECGWGRTDPTRLPGLLGGHRAAAESLS